MASTRRAIDVEIVVDADDPRGHDRALVGGKAASLATLRSLGCRVPPFFVITTAAYRRHAPGAAGALADEVRRGLDHLGAGTGPVAVRSSAVGEDSADHSFAGLFATVLDVVGVDDVIAAVERCWASADAEEARAYRAELDEETDVAMAVVVQRMVPAEWAGVAFGVNAVTQNLDEFVIEATPGLGEALVSGAVNPEQVVVGAVDGIVRSRTAGAVAAVLPDAALHELWRITADLGVALGFPQDVEWALADGVVHVLQSRPVPTVADVFYSRYLEPWRNDAAARPDDPDRLWTRAYADEIWSPPVSPLFYNVQNLTGSFAGYMRWHHDATALPPDVFKYHRACAYLDVDVLRRQYAYHPRLQSDRRDPQLLPVLHAARGRRRTVAMDRPVAPHRPLRAPAAAAAIAALEPPDVGVDVAGARGDDR